MTRSLQSAAHTAAGLDQAWSALGRAGGWFSGSDQIIASLEFEELGAARA